MSLRLDSVPVFVRGLAFVVVLRCSDRGNRANHQRGGRDFGNIVARILARGAAAALVVGAIAAIAASQDDDKGQPADKDWH